MKVNKIIKTISKEELEITGATLLSIEEAEEYLRRVERAYNCWWWLRSPGDYYNYTANVYYYGDIYKNGHNVGYNNGYVRPALQIKNLESSNFKIDDIFELGGFEFKIISDNLAWMYKQDIGQYVFNKDVKKGNDYETSDVKEFIDKWFERIVMFNRRAEKMDD